MSKVVVFVLGAARSGTTMLDAMLGNSKNAFSVGEVRNWYRPNRREYRTLDCVCGETPCPVWERLGGFSDKNFHANVFQECGVDFVIDSSKTLDWLIDSCAAIPENIEIRCVVIWKDPIRSSYSHWKRGENAQDWRRPFIWYYKRLFALGMPFVSVRYDEFVHSPNQKLARICEKINMPYQSGQENFWRKDHHFLFGSHGVRQQVAAGRARIYEDEPYPEEFLAIRSQLEQRIENDTELSKIKTNLERFEVDNANPVDWDNLNRKIKKPGWYYLAKARDNFRKYFPQRYAIKDVNPLFGQEAPTKIEER